MTELINVISSNTIRLLEHKSLNLDDAFNQVTAIDTTQKSSNLYN